MERVTPWANRDELYVGLLRDAFRKDMRESKSPMVLWDYAIDHRALTHNAFPHPLFQDQGKNIINTLLADANGCFTIILFPSLKIRRS